MTAKCGAEAEKTAKAAIHPNVKELHWAAGFLEGEGHFRQTRTSEHVNADQVEYEPVRRLLEMFGGSLILAKHVAPHSNIWRWSVSGARARGVMLTLYPLLSEKRQTQIKAALE